MNVRHWEFILSMILVPVGATLALGQTVPPSAGLARSATSIPDFSGKWVHPYFPGFEPPASGPGPIVNKSRRRDGVGKANQFVGDYTNRSLKPHAAEVVRNN